MPQVQMPDGTVVEMPDDLPPEMATRLRKFQDEYQPPRQRTGWQEMGRQLGLTARAAIEGNPVSAMGRMLGDVAGVRTSQTLSNLLTRAGLPVPETQIERLAQMGAQGMAGAAGSIGLGRSLQQAASPVVAGVGEQLAAQPIRQTLSGAASGLAAETAAQFGVGPMGQLIASMAGGLVPFARAPRVDAPQARQLAERGVQMTPGQIAGGGWNKAEAAISKIPVIGAPITKARAESLVGFNNATINDGLKIVGETLPAGLKGQDSIAWARQALGQKFEDVLRKTSGDLYGRRAGTMPVAPGQVPRPSLNEDLNTIREMGRQGLPPELAGQLDRTIQREVIDKFTRAGKATGQTLNDILGNLRDLTQTQMRSENADVRRLGQGFKEVMASIERMIERENPAHAAELQRAKAAWAKFKIAQRASTSAGAKEGIFTPAQYKMAVRAKDVTKDKRAFAEGAANQQVLAEAAKGVLPEALPDSGTPYQLTVLDAVIGGGALWAAPKTALAGLATYGAYNRPALQAIQRQMLGPTETSGLPAALVGQAMQRGMSTEGLQ